MGYLTKILQTSGKQNEIWREKEGHPGNPPSQNPKEEDQNDQQWERWREGRLSLCCRGILGHAWSGTVYRLWSKLCIQPKMGLKSYPKLHIFNGFAGIFFEWFKIDTSNFEQLLSIMVTGSWTSEMDCITKCYNFVIVHVSCFLFFLMQIRVTAQNP